MRAVFNVEDYGAAGDGTYSAGVPPAVDGTDDTELFQDAIDAAAGAHGGVVYVPAGYYKISGRLTLSENVKLVGESTSRNGWDHTSWTSGIEQGSVLLPLESSGREPFIDLRYKNAAIEGITIFYGQQLEPHCVRGNAEWAHHSQARTLKGVTNCASLRVGDRIRNDQDDDGVWYQVAATPTGDTVALDRPYIGANTGTQAFTAFTPYSPTPYPWTIQGGVHNDLCDNVVKDVLLVNPYKAIQFDTQHSSRFTIENVVCGALHRGISIDYATDVNVLNNVHFQTFRCHRMDNDVEHLAIEAYTLANLTAIELKRADNFIMNNISMIYANKGVVLNPEQSPEKYGSWGCISNILLDCVETGIEANCINQTHGIMISNFTISSPEAGPHWEGTTTGVAAGPDNKGSLHLCNGVFSGTKFNRHIEWWSGEPSAQSGLLVTNCNLFHHGHHLQQPIDSIVVRSGSANVSNCQFIGDFGQSKGRYAIKSDSTAALITVSGNSYNGNHIGGPGSIYIDHVPSVFSIDATAGLVGVGTTSPQGPLHVVRSANGDIGGSVIIDNPDNSVDAGAAVEFYSINNAASGYSSARIRTFHRNGTVGSEEDELRVSTRQSGNMTDVLTIDSRGDVGIGTTAPQGSVHVARAARGCTGGSLIIDNPHNSLDAGAAVEFYSLNNAAVGYPSARIRTFHRNGTVGSEEDELRVSTRQSGKMSDVLAIDTDGNVGVGTASPHNRLHVNGAIALTKRAGDPPRPAEGTAVIWVSDGIGKGRDGDLMIASNPTGRARYGTLFEYSSGTDWD